MSVTQVKNSNYVLVGKDVGSSSPATINDLADGEIGVFDAAGNSGATGAGDKFIIALGGPNGKPKFVSEVLSDATVIKAFNRGDETAVEQVTHIGFNGTDGTIANLIAEGYYKVDFYIQEYLTSNTDGRYIKHGQWIAGATAPTQAEVADGVALSIVQNFSREAEDYIQVDVLNSAASVVTAGTVDVTEGSKVATLSVAGDVAANGDYLRLGNTANDPMYKVVSGAGTTTVTFDRPVNQSTQQFAIGAADSITNAAADAADAGIEITGKALSFTVGKEQYKKVRWTTLISEDFGATENRTDTAADRGVGTYEQAAEAEWFARGQEGEYHRMGEPVLYSSDLYADSTKTYDVLSISYEDNSVVGFQNVNSPKTIEIYSPVGATYMTATDANGGVRLSLEGGLTASKLSNRNSGETSVSTTLTF